MKWALIWWLSFISGPVATSHVDGFTTHKACSAAFAAMAATNQSSGLQLRGVCVPLDENAP
jgi:hypothetical protein